MVVVVGVGVVVVVGVGVGVGTVGGNVVVVSTSSRVIQ